MTTKRFDTLPPPLGMPDRDREACLKYRVLMLILAVGFLSTISVAALLYIQGTISVVWGIPMGVSLVFHPALLLGLWRGRIPLPFVEIVCLLFLTGTCLGLMAYRLYAGDGPDVVDIRLLYLWTPINYVLVFIFAGNRNSLLLCAVVFAGFLALSLPYIAMGPMRPDSVFTIQLHLMSAVLIAALYFFSTYQYHLQIARMTVEDLHRLANTDPLTQLPNRRATLEKMAAEFERFKQYGSVFSVVIIDIDHFKAINDRFGHAVGDTTLTALPACISPLLRSSDTFGRWGGEEFVIILPETPHAKALEIAAGLCVQVAQWPLLEERVVTISCGVACARVDDTLDQLMERADKALYTAKRGGRNRAAGIYAHDVRSMTATKAASGRTSVPD